MNIGENVDFERSMKQLHIDPRIVRTRQERFYSIDSLSRTTQDQIAAIIKTRQFQNWIASLDSAVLFVNCPSKESVFATPSEFISNQLRRVADLNDNRTAVLTFSCLEHSNKTDPEYGAVGILRSLVAQLLASFPQLDVQSLRRKRSNSRELEDLCNIFARLFMH